MKNTIFTSTTTTKSLRIAFQQNGIEVINVIQEHENNWAFLDMQNLHKEVMKRGWKINWNLFRNYLEKNHNVTNAVVFMGYIKENYCLYRALRNAGFVLEFRKVYRLENGKIEGGNIDTDLASYAMDYKNDYQKAIIIADDGDYYRTIASLIRQNKLKLIISSHPIERTSGLLKEIALEFIISIDSIKHIIEYKEQKSVQTNNI